MSKSINVEELKAQMSSLVNSNEAIENVLGKVQTETKIEETILEMQKEATEWVKTCSANNVIKVEESNQEFVNKIEKLVTQLSKEGINKYFMSGNVSTEHLLNSLYSLQALASNYMYNQHNGKKAREILLKSKELAEQYVLNRSSVSFDFDELTKEETHIKLNIITDLPEMYTGIIYLLGRTYMYQGNKADAIQYFELSKYLGDKLKLFECCLSDRSGLGVIKREEIEKDIANEDYEQATNKLNESVQLYQKLKSDNTIYKEGYKPGTGEYKKYNQTIPAQDGYNQVECSEQLIKYYMQLLTLTNDKVKYSEYVHEISHQFIGSDTSPGMLKRSKDIPIKKVASIHNSLGDVLLKLYDQQIDFQEFKDTVSKELQLTKEANLTERDDLNVIKQIFTLAKAKGRQGDFTEADAYNGLRMVCYRQLKQGVEEGQREELLSSISAYKKARDEINKALNRTIKYDESDVENTTTATTVPLTSSTSLLVNLAENTEDTAVQPNLMGADSVSHSDIEC